VKTLSRIAGEGDRSPRRAVGEVSERRRVGIAADRRLTWAGGAAEHRPAPGICERLPAMEMQDRAVIVTGGASGIGKAAALLLACEGARVFVGDVDENGGQALAAQAASDGLAVRFLPLDLTRTASIEAFAGAVHAEAGRVDGLVNGAGWDRIQPFIENPPEMWDRLIAINLMGAIRLTRAVLEPMVAARAGKIVNISSDAGRVGSTGETVYAAAKGGLIAFTKSLARELARYRINVNCVCPGPTDTPLFQAQPERMREALTRAIPFRRIAQPEEIAEAIMFFLGRRTDYVTGQVLSVSGGLTMVD
jgi:2-hydroxycyclohexanecarboxyl-CoA dehydrogenase